MGQFKVILPAMGEGIFEATITKWLVNEGDKIEEDDSLVEVATDKVDSEVPAPEDGVVEKILIPEGEIAKVGEEIMILKIAGDSKEPKKEPEKKETESKPESTTKIADKSKEEVPQPELDVLTKEPAIPARLENGVFLSPLVRSIADKENITEQELKTIKATGLNERLTKDDLVEYLNNKTQKPEPKTSPMVETQQTNVDEPHTVVEMNRMRKLIADHMVRSKQVSPHVTSFHEVDVTNIVKWRDKNKAKFAERYGEKLTYTPIFIEAVVNAIRKYPMINISVQGDKLLVKKPMNIGMATALPDGNLIVPVIKQAEQLSLSGLASRVNDLALRARNKQLQPNEIQGGTFTVTNVGTFGNLSGTPIINQPEVAILALGAIKKRPAVIETSQGDTIGIRHQMILSMSYDHRVVDGSLGGMFIKQVADNLEAFDTNREV